MATIGDTQNRLVRAIELSKGVSFEGSRVFEASSAFEAARLSAVQTTLLEIAPAGFADAPAALGFALAWMKAGADDGLMFWAAPENSFSEFGAPNAEGLAQFGIDPHTLVLARTQNQLDALWAAEQALTLPCARVLCTIAQSPKSLSLSASRRLLLNAEKSGAHCVLLRFDPLSPSAARSRWRISAAASHADNHGFGHRELGAPAFNVQLERNRAGLAGQMWRVDWNAHERIFQERPITEHGVHPGEAANDAKPEASGKQMAGAASAAPFYRPPATHTRRAS